MMPRWALTIMAVLALVAGCGESAPSTPAEVGLMHLGKGRYEQAIAACDEAIRLNPRDANAYLIRGRAHQFRNENGDAALAIADFTESIHISPQQTEAYYSRAIAYRDQGNAEKSLADEAKARQLDTAVEETYSHLPETSQPQGVISLEKPASETSSATATQGAEPPTIDPLTESLRQRHELGLDAEERRSGSAVAGPGTRGSSRDRTRDPLSSNSRNSRPRAGDETTDDRGNYNRNQLYATPKAQPYNNSKGWNLPLNSQEAMQQERGAEGMRRAGSRGVSSSRGDEPVGPTTPGRPRGGRLSDLPRLPSPVQPAFPQLPPRPTGYVEDQVQTPFRQQPRQTFSTPFTVPTVHPPGAYHEDYNP